MKNVVYLERLYDCSLLYEEKDYVLQKEDIYARLRCKKNLLTIRNFLIYDLKLNFPGITKSKLYKLLQPTTENIFNTGTEITSFAPKYFEINEQSEVEALIKKTQFIEGSYFSYDKSNVIKRYFLTEPNKFLSIYCSISYFGERKAINQHK